MGIVLLLLFVVLKIGLAHLHPVNQVTDAAFSLLHPLLANPSSRSSPKVVIVDIGRLPSEFVPGHEGPITRRTQLAELLTSLARFRPKVIAVDIDLGPPVDDFLPEGSEEFLRTADEIASRGIVVLLGFHRSWSRSPKKWLGHPVQFATATPITWPANGHGAFYNLHYETNQLLSMSGIAAASLLGYPPVKAKSWVIEQQREFEDQELSGTRVYVNFASYPELAANRVILPSESWNFDAALQRAHDDRIAKSGEPLFEDKIIFVGDAGNTAEAQSDRVPTPIGLIQGVYAHACAANTLLNRPVASFREVFSLGLLTGMSLLCLICLEKLPENSQSGNGAALRVLIVTLLIGLVAVLTLALAMWFSIVWCAASLVCVLLAMHGAMEIVVVNVKGPQLLDVMKEILNALGKLLKALGCLAFLTPALAVNGQSDLSAHTVSVRMQGPIALLPNHNHSHQIEGFLSNRVTNFQWVLVQPRTKLIIVLAGDTQIDITNASGRVATTVVPVLPLTNDFGNAFRSGSRRPLKANVIRAGRGG